MNSLQISQPYNKPMQSSTVNRKQKLFKLKAKTKKGKERQSEERWGKEKKRTGEERRKGRGEERE